MFLFLQLSSISTFFGTTKIIIDMIERFIIRGKISDYDIDVLVSETINDYI